MNMIVLSTSTASPLAAFGRNGASGLSCLSWSELLSLALGPHALFRSLASAIRLMRCWKEQSACELDENSKVILGGSAKGKGFE